MGCSNIDNEIFFNFQFPISCGLEFYITGVTYFSALNSNLKLKIIITNVLKGLKKKFIQVIPCKSTKH